MVVAVTGIDGFLGGYIKPLLQEKGFTVLSVSRKAGYDIRKVESLQSLPHFDVVVHLAAISYVPDAYIKPHLFYDTNVNGTLNVLEQARRYDAKMIYVSSYVYGQPHYQPIDEMHPVQPFNPYAQSKILAEELCSAYYRDFKVPCTVFRPFNIYGFGQAEHFLIPKLISQHLQDNEVTIFDARPRRDYVHVKDVTTAILLALEAKSDDYNIYNLGGGKSYSIPDICHLLQEITGKPLRLKIMDQQRPAEILDTVCNYQRANEKLQWDPSMSLQRGLEEMIEKMTVTG